MESIRQFLLRTRDQIAGFWKSLDLLKRVGVVAAVLGVLAGIILLAFAGRSEPYSYLFVDLSAEDNAAVAGYLKNNGFNDYVIDKKGIKVRPEEIVRLRIELSQEGLPAKGVVGWEKFDEENFTRTEFEQNIQKQRAIQGELARTIESIEGVTSARVHIVQPESTLFVRETKPATAAIYIRTKRGQELARRQIRGIQHLVSGSVEGLDINSVTIIDQSGRMMTEAEPTDFSSKMTKEILSYKGSIEGKLEERIRGIVGRIVGMERVEAKVDAEVDFTQETQSISDVDPDDVAVIAKVTTGFEMEGSGLNPLGIPGSKSNVPGEQEDVAASGNKTGSKRESERLNYDVSKTRSEKILPVGNIKRLSVSVLVDGKQAHSPEGKPAEFIPRTPEEMKKIEELVKAAVGYKDGRDSLTVHNMLFQLDQTQVMALHEKVKEEWQYQSTLAVAAVTALVLTLFFAFVVRPYFRWLSYDPQRKSDESFVEEFKPDLEATGIQNVKTQEDVPFEKMTPQGQILHLAKHEPKRTTEALRLMLNPNA